MVIDQRNDSSPVTTNGSFICDRFQVAHSSNGAFSAQQIVEAPDQFKTSLKVTTTTADASGLTGTQQLVIRQLIEGFNTIRTAFGKSGAKTLSLSFWVRSSLTGTFGGSVSNGAEDRSYIYSYTINVANTWEYKTITIPGDTTGTWLVNNGIGMRVNWSLGTGPDLSETAGSWYSASRRGVTGGVSVIDTLNATWQITGVQLEVGTKATPFEHRPYGTELALCQRYYEVCYSGIRAEPTGSYLGVYTPYKVEKRTLPTLTEVSGTGQGNLANSFQTFNAPSTFGVALQWGTAGKTAPYLAYGFQFLVDAEL
jgi:hypothetical protein